MRTIILGLGVTGLSCARYLATQGDELSFADTRISAPNFEQLRREFPNSLFDLGELDYDYLIQADRIVISPGISIHHPILQAVQKKIPIMSDIELFVQHIKAPVIAITGTNGKSTVTTLVAEMCVAAGLNAIAAGNLGTPVCDLLSQPEPDYYVLELSSFQLSTTESLKPIAATILNITPDHLDWHKDFSDYCAAKQKIYHHAQYRIINRDDFLTAVVASDYSFGQSKPQSSQEFGLADGYLCQGEDKILAISALKILGVHNYLNALAALALGTAIGLPLTAMLDALKTFSGLPHRCQLVSEYQGIKWINDSKATNLASALSAITSVASLIQGKIVLIAGGDAKGTDLSPLRKIAEQHLSAAILLGKDAPQLAQVLEGVCGIQRVDNLAQAVKSAQEVAQVGDAILLAPACSSLDMFKDYQDRGTQFKKEVLRLQTS